MISFFLFSGEVFAEVSGEGQALRAPSTLSKLKKECGGLLYRSKKDSIPVYYEQDLTSGVLKRLTLGEKVCVIGKKEAFAILDSRLLELENENSLVQAASEGEPSDLAYARIVDLWPPRDLPTSSSTQSSNGFLLGMFYKAKNYFKRLRYGPPDDALEPYGSVLDKLNIESNRYGH